MMLAAQALTTQAISGGRLTLGIGLSHQLVIEGMFGHSFEKPVRHMREYLSILMPLIHEGTVSCRGETLSANGSLNIAGATPFPVLIAALGPKMLELAGTAADGTITWMTGPATLESHTVPAITKAAEQAGRPPPRLCVGLPVCVTDDPDRARERGQGLELRARARAPGPGSRGAIRPHRSGSGRRPRHHGRDQPVRVQELGLGHLAVQ